MFVVFPAFTSQNKRFQNVTRKAIREDNTCKTMGGQIKLKNNEAFELSGCLARLAQSKVFQDLKIVCQVLCICCLAFRHFLGNLLVVGDEHCTLQPNASLLLAVYVQHTHAILSIADVERQNICKTPSISHL